MIESCVMKRGGFSYSFWKSKYLSWFFNKRPWLCPPLGYIFFTENVVLREFKRKTSKCFPKVALFLMFLTKFLSKSPNSENLPPFPEMYSEFVSAWIRIIIRYAASDTFEILTYSALCFFNYIYADYIQRYSVIFTHTETLLRHTYAYSSTLCCVTFEYSQPYQILNPYIFRTWCLFNTL